MNAKQPEKAVRGRGAAHSRFRLPPAELRPYVAPWAASAAAWPVSGLAYWAWSDDPVMTAAMGGSSAVLTWLTYRTWAARHEATRLVATWFTGLETAWVTVAAAVGPWDPFLTKAWLLGAPLLSIAWNLRHAGLTGVTEKDQAAAKDHGGDASLFDHLPRLKGSRTKKVEQPTDGRLEALVQLPPGEVTPADVQQELERIAGVMAIDASALTAAPVKGRADQVTLAVQMTDATASSPHWPGFSAPGRSIADAPLVIGRRADGSPLEFWTVGSADRDNPRPLPHTLAVGMTGAGKTETVRTAIVDMRSRVDAVPIVADPAKFGQSFGDIADLLEIAADGPTQSQQLIRNLPEVIEYRARLLGSLGFKQWVPECWTKHRIPAIFLDIEEATDVLEGGNGSFDEAIRKCRSVGISLCASLQVAVYENIDRKTRGQFGNSLAHGCKEMQDAKFALNANTLNAGADPTKWQNDVPGSLYAELVGTPKEKWSMDARAFYLTPEEIDEVRKLKSSWAVLDPGTAKILGKGVNRPDVSVPDDAVTVELERIDTPAPQPSAVPVDMRKEIAPEKEEDVLAALPEIPEEYGPIDVDREIPALTAPVFSWRRPRDPQRRMTDDAARLLLEQRIDAIEIDMTGKGQTPQLDVREFSDLPELTGHGRGWLLEHLERLADAGRLTAGDGRTYGINPRVCV